MKLRASSLLALAACLVTAAVVPALASAAETKLEVNLNCVEPNWPCWATPGSSQPALKVTIAAGGTITFVDMKTAANLAWNGTAPTCEPGVPIAPAPPATGWEGKCTFTAPGTYKFESSTLFNVGIDNYTRYEVLVGGTPKAETMAAGGQTQTGATLTGIVEPEGGPTEYRFVYGSASLTEHSSAKAALGATDFARHSVSVPVSGLSPGTEYQFELIVSYGIGLTVSGGPQSFTTPAAAEPTAGTLAASAIKETEATLNGSVDPEGGGEAEYLFEWGAGSGEAYEHATDAVSLPSDGAEHRVSASVSGLMPGAGYHFRIVAKNSLGTVQGHDVTFTTTTTPPATGPPGGSSPTQPQSEPPPTAATGGTAMTAPGPPASNAPRSEPASGPLFGSLELPSTAHGAAVHGSLSVSSAAVGGRLRIELFAKGVATPVGKLARSALKVGKLTFAVPLTTKGKAMLRAQAKLALTVKITLTPPQGPAVSVTRRVVVR
jgi:hypothetical protein